jgi:uncharacterized protein
MRPVYFAFWVGIINDIFLFGFSSASRFLLVDYSSRLVLFGCIWIYFKQNALPLNTFGHYKPTLKHWGVIILTTGLLYGMYALSLHWLGNPLRINLGFNYDNDVQKLFDLTIGLIMVAFTEEFVFRGMMLREFHKVEYGPRKLNLSQAFMFMLVHWGTGVTNLFLTFVTGLVLGHLMLKYRNIIIPVIIHYLLNLIIYSQV